jgi:hypothetical protein
MSSAAAVGCIGMTNKTKQIRALIEQWAAAVHSGDMDGVLADHADDIVMFELVSLYAQPQDGRLDINPRHPLSLAVPRRWVSFAANDQVQTKGKSIWRTAHKVSLRISDF